jgi:AcrR family transcriptional regulator
MRAIVHQPGSPTPSARERILAEAFVLFYAEGIRAVGVDLLISRAEVAKATFYRHFASKNDLIVAYVDRRRTAWLGWLTEAVAERAERPEDRLLAVFDALAELLTDPEYRGCAVHNAVVEAGRDAPGVAASALAHEADLLRYLTGLAAEAGIAAPDELAARWVLLIDGACVGALRVGGPAPALEARAAAQFHLADAGATAAR